MGASIKTRAVHLTSGATGPDREAIRGWLVRALLKSGVWGSGLDTLLTAIRSALREHGGERFPAVAIEATMRARGKTLRFEAEELEDLVDVAYGDRRVLPLLSLLFPFHDLRHEFHIDHVFPRSRFSETRLAKDGVAAGVRPDWIDRADRLANLQLLDGVVNTEKNATLPGAWLERTFRDPIQQNAFAERHLLGRLPDSVLGFDKFYETRRRALLERLQAALGTMEARAPS